MAKKVKDFTVIIPTVGRPILKECLDALLKGHVLPIRIVVIDQGENPEVADWIKINGVSGVDILHIRSTGRSPSSARNEGMAEVETSFMAAIDDDCLAEPDWLEVIDLHLQKNPNVIVTGRVEAAGNGVPQTVVTSTTPFLMSSLPIRNLSPLATGNMGTSFKLAQKIGNFDENLYTAEDTDWAYRAMRAGIPVLYAPDVIVNHHHWRDSSQTTVNYQAYAIGLGAFYGKHLRHGDWSMVPRALLALYRGAKSLFKGLKNQDENLTLEGKARLTKLIPGLVAGLRGVGFSRQQRGKE